MNKSKLILWCASFFIAFSLTGCGKDEPFPPRTYYGSVEDMVIRDFNINSVKVKKGSILNHDSKIAILSFESPSDTQGGVLVSDVLSLLLQRKGFQVIERDHINKVLEEHNLMKGKQAAVSDLEIANKIGKLVSVDYMVFGAVTLYDSEGQIIYLPVKVKQEDREAYAKKYNEYKEWYINKFFPLFESKEERIEKLRAKDGVLSIEEMEEELKKISKTEFRNIATIGISAKIVDVKSTKIEWMAQGETVDFTLVSGANRILEKFINSM